MEKYCGDGQATHDNIIWHMCIAYWIPKATDTHSEYVIFIALPQQHWLHECTCVTLYILTCHVKFYGSYLKIIGN